jgi:SAM-dependent methyltransferase
MGSIRSPTDPDSPVDVSGRACDRPCVTSDGMVARWLEGLAARHLTRFSLKQVARALRALSACYVERRARLARGEALSGAGKRAAFALFYGPLHFLLTQAAVRALGAATPAPRDLLDLGCGTGAAGLAWALEATASPRVRGIDRHPWAVAEANWSYRWLGVLGRARRADLRRAPLHQPPDAIVAAFVVNELAQAVRDELLDRLLGAHRRGSRILVLEPVARRIAPWWDRWQRAFVAAGGRADVWEVALDLPPLLASLDRAAGLDHRVVKVRSLWLPGWTR